MFKVAIFTKIIFILSSIEQHQTMINTINQWNLDDSSRFSINASMWINLNQ